MKKAISTKTLLFLKTLFITLIIVAPNKASALFNSATFASSTVTLGGYNMIISGQIESLNSSLSAINVALSPGSFFTLISADKKDFAITVSGVSSHTKTCSTNNSSIVFTSPASMSTSSISISGNCAGIVSSPLQITAVSGTAGDSSASISWTAPSDGGSPITDYIIEYKSSGAATYAIFNDGINTNTSATISSLSNGTSYNFRVTALNAIGLSASSSIVSITPVAAVSNGGGGGGGGGGSYYIPPIIIPAATNTKASSTNPTSTPVVTITPTTTINKNIVTPISILLYPNIIHPEVKTLQIFLNSNGYTIAKTGTGSKGYETNRMGPGTVVALKKFQNDNKIYPANGYTGIATRNKINSRLSVNISTTTIIVTQPPVSTSTIAKLTKLLSPGNVDLEVKTLQIFLNSNGYTIAISGPSSKGNETSYMSPATVIALKKFQRNNSILANGYVGIATRNKINSLLK